MVKSGGGSLSPLDLDYLCEIVQETISKLPLPYQVLLISIALVIILLFALNREIFDRWVESYRKKLNRFLWIAFIMLIICLTAVFIFDYFHSPAPPEDQLVVAISPFYYSDVSGKSGADSVTADEFKERLEAEKDLGIKVIMLKTPIRNAEAAKTQGQKAGAHLVVYGETKRKMGNREEIIYHILPLLSLEITPSEIPSLGARAEDENGLISGKATYFAIIEESITIIESLTENASSAIYTIGAFENYKKLDFTSAITFFKSIKSYENDSLILFYIANCYYYNNNLDESVQYFDKDIEINPQDAVAWNNKGVALDDLGRYEEAIAAYDRAIEINSQLAEAWNNKGNALSGLGRYYEAIAAYDRAIMMEPPNPAAWNNKGNALCRLGIYEVAIAAYNITNVMDPQCVEAWNNKGIALFYLGRYEEAIAACDKALEIDPQHTAAWYIKGNTLDDLGRYEEAIAAYDKAIEIDIHYADAWCNKGATLGKLDRREEAIAAYDKAIEINPQLAEAWSNKGDALNDLSRYEEAIAVCDKAIEINPQLAEAWSNKGDALVGLDRYEEAKEAFEKAHEIDPTIEIP